jgi:hypothetical protein
MHRYRWVDGLAAPLTPYEASTHLITVCKRWAVVTTEDERLSPQCCLAVDLEVLQGVAGGLHQFRQGIGD